MAGTNLNPTHHINELHDVDALLQGCAAMCGSEILDPSALSRMLGFARQRLGAAIDGIDTAFANSEGDHDA